MHPVPMTVLLVTLVSTFLYSVRRRWSSVIAGRPTPDPPTDQLGARLRAVYAWGLAQRKMRHYPLAGLAHQLIFFGFLLLLVRSLVLFTRGFVPEFELGHVLPHGAIGRELTRSYAFVKDVFVGLVLVGTGVFLYIRLVLRPRRLTLNREGLLILGIIACMMLADLTYDGALIVLNARDPRACAGADPWCARAAVAIAPLGPPVELGWRVFPDPGGSAFAVLFSGLGLPALVVLATLGFWTHVTLVLLFLNLLPFSKHFHVITALPNIFLSDLGPPGRLPPLARSSDHLMQLVEQATDSNGSVVPIGCASFEHLTWKDRLDLLTCTECGRCSDHCPATITGKELDPKRFTVNLRSELRRPEPARELVPRLIRPNVLWACTTCRACEEHCPVSIGYVRKIVAMRQNLVMMRGEEFPPELRRLFDALETNGNPWNLARQDRARWADGLDVRTAAQHPTGEVLLWVGCAASYDPRAQKVARAMARLLRAARVDFAILGEEESCTGDPARRAGNEHLFLTLVERNLETLARYRARGAFREIVTLCPHCQNTLRHEYPDFGEHCRVVSHVSLLGELVNSGRLVPERPVAGSVVYHDSCYLGRYLGEYREPRELIDRLPGVRRVEVRRFAGQHGFCCGAGGAQMWLEEQNERRVNQERLAQLAATGANIVASACPYCLMMLEDARGAREDSDRTDSLVARPRPDRSRDIAELLADACGLSGVERAAS